MDAFCYWHFEPREVLAGDKTAVTRMVVGYGVRDGTAIKVIVHRA
jgi:hypothetical protein